MRKTVKIFGFMCAAAAFLATPASAREKVVVELFTSQGCSSCPPADRFLGELAGRDDVLALSMHVDYWDYIGWKDPYALSENTSRQRAYARRFGLGYVYTPQMVVDGHIQATGSNRRAVLAGIERSKSEPGLDFAIARNGTGASVALPAGTAEPATVYALLIDRRHETDVRRGENGGRKLAHSNVVRAMKRIATWNGEAMTVDLPLAEMGTEGRDLCAVIVQSDRDGRILGAAVTTLR